MPEAHEPALHATARAFGDLAEAYERGRPGYPAEAVAWLASALELAPGRTVADVGAGTGKLAAALAGTGARVLAVEPLDAMRALIPRTVTALAGAAEALPIADGAVDAITAATAMHWFDLPRALAEFRRVLRPEGRLAVLWNSRDERDPVQARIGEIMQPARGSTPTHSNESWREALPAAGFAQAGEKSFRFVHELDRAGLVQRVASVSFVAALPEDRREPLLDEVRALAAGLPEPIPLPTITQVHVFRLSAARGTAAR
jgi:ubiquinone/menaquinone biosynthesis C-methylase UbiE